MKNKNKSKKGASKYIIAILGILVSIVVIMVVINKVNSSYDNLNATDQLVLKEINEYNSKTKSDDIWEGFELRNKTILALKDSFGEAYLINPQNKVSSIFTKQIKMPEDYEINVYRVSSLDPQLIKFRTNGNFNTIGENYNFHKNNVYYTKYDDSDSVDRKFSSKHYITFLSHESFHYYMQNEWAKGEGYSVDNLSKNDTDLLYQEYDVLRKIQSALLNDEKNKDVYKKYTKEYNKIVKKRIESNAEYMKKELDRETTEGTATYIGIKASELVVYDFGVMYFDNVKNIPFSDLKRAIDSDAFDKQNLASRIPYETGALLCLLMEKMEIPDWQDKLNNQTKDNQINLHSIIDDYLNTIN